MSIPSVYTNAMRESHKQKVHDLESGLIQLFFMMLMMHKLFQTENNANVLRMFLEEIGKPLGQLTRFVGLSMLSFKVKIAVNPETLRQDCPGYAIGAVDQ